MPNGDRAACSARDRLLREARESLPRLVETAQALVRAASPNPPGRQDVDWDILEQGRDPCSARIGDQADAMAALLQLCGERMRRDHMAAGSAGGEDDIHARSPLHLTT